MQTDLKTDRFCMVVLVVSSRPVLGERFFSLMSCAGYNGTTSLEMEGLTMAPLTGMKKSLVVLKEALPRGFESHSVG